MVLIYKQVYVEQKKQVYECGFDMIQEEVTFLGVVSIISFRTHLEIWMEALMYLHHTQLPSWQLFLCLSNLYIVMCKENLQISYTLR